MSCGAPCTQGLEVEGSGSLGSVAATDRAAVCSAQPGWSHTALPALQELGAGQPALSARPGATAPLPCHPGTSRPCAASHACCGLCLCCELQDTHGTAALARASTITHTLTPLPSDQAEDGVRREADETLPASQGGSFPAMRSRHGCAGPVPPPGPPQQGRGPHHRALPQGTAGGGYGVWGLGFRPRP